MYSLAVVIISTTIFVTYLNKSNHNNHYYQHNLSNIWYKAYYLHIAIQYQYNYYCIIYIYKISTIFIVVGNYNDYKL